MSHCETAGWSACNECGGQVAVKRNRSGMAYYRCDHCGVHVQHHWHRNSDKLLQAVGFAGQDAAPVAVKTEEAPAMPTPTKTKPAPRSLVATLLSI